MVKPAADSPIIEQMLKLEIKYVLSFTFLIFLRLIIERDRLGSMYTYVTNGKIVFLGS